MYPVGPNFIVPTAPAGDSSNREASTQFVTNAIGSAISSLPAGLSSTQTDFLAGGISFPSNLTYSIVQRVFFPMTLTLLAARLGTGQVTAVLKVNTNTVTGTPVSISTSAQVTAILSAANTATTGDVLNFEITGTSGSPQLLTFSIQFTRTLSTA